METQFEFLCDINPIAKAIMENGGSAEDCAVELARANERLMQGMMNLQQIAPFKIKLEDGRVLIWRCPEEFVPLR